MEQSDLESTVNYWICGKKVSKSSPVRLFIQKLLWVLDEGFIIALCVTPQTRYLHAIQIWIVIRWPMFLSNHLRSRTVLIETAAETCNERRALCISLNVPFHLAAVGCILQ